MKFRPSENYRDTRVHGYRGWLALIVALFPVIAVHAQERTAGSTQLSGKVELARLIDLCVDRLGLTIEYDPTTVRQSVTLRLDGPATDQELWALTNRLLLSRGLASVRLPGPGDVLSIVPASDAKDQARVEPAADTAAHVDAGYQSMLLPAVNRSATFLADAAKPLASKYGRIQPIADDSFLLISENTGRLDRILGLIRLLDIPHVPPTIERIPAQYVIGSQLAAVATAIATNQSAVDGRVLRGKLTGTQDDTAVILIAPPQEVEYWHNLIARMDQQEAVETRSYSTGAFDPTEVQRLIEQTVRLNSPRGSGGQWKVVVDAITGSIIATCTTTEHLGITSTMARLDELPAESRRPMRTYLIRNRSVREIMDVLGELIDSGVLAASNPNETSAGDRQTTAVPDDARPRNTRSSDTGPGRRHLMLTADEGTNTLIAVAESRTLKQLETLLRTLDIRQPQVMIEVLVVSLTDANTLDLGVELDKLELSGSTAIRLTSLFGLGGNGDVDSLPSAGAGFGAAVLSPGDFSIVIRALNTINNGRAINLPKVLANNNETATLDAVLEEPFISTNASDTVATTSFGGASSAGTQITVTPHIAEGDHLILEYDASISAFVGESSNASLPPPRQENSISSTITVPDGYTVVVGGLELTTEAEAESRVPILGDIPLVGAAFKNRSQSQSRSRFYVFIRANVLRNQSFEDLKYISDQDVLAGQITDDQRRWPTMAPRVIK